MRIIVRNTKSSLIKQDLGKSLDIIFKGVRVLRTKNSRYNSSDWTDYSFLTYNTILCGKSEKETLEIRERSLGKGNVGVVCGSAVLPIKLFLEINKNL